MRFNYGKKYFSIKTRDYEFITEKEIKVNKHIIRKKDGVRYYTGKLYLPSKYFNYGGLVSKKYLRIKIKYPIHILPKDWWAEGYILFVPTTNIASKKLSIKSSSVQYEFNNNYCSFLKHSRVSKNRIYTSSKLLIPFKIGDSIYIIGLKEGIVLQNYTTNFKKNTQFGKGYLFIKLIGPGKSNSLILSQENNRMTKHETIFILLNSHKDTKQIATQMKCSENAIWRHVANYFKEGKIDLKRLKEIIQDNSSRKIMDSSFLTFEKLRKDITQDINKYATNDRIDYLKLTFNQEFKISNIYKKYFMENRTVIMINQLECILLFYKNLGRDERDYSNYKPRKIIRKFI